MHVARVGHLVALKLLADGPTVRPQDGLDLHALRTVLDAAEVQRAREACDLITLHGYTRECDLLALLDDFLATQK